MKRTPDDNLPLLPIIGTLRSENSLSRVLKLTAQKFWGRAVIYQTQRRGGICTRGTDRWGAQCRLAAREAAERQQRSSPLLSFL